LAGHLLEDHRVPQQRSGDLLDDRGARRGFISIEACRKQASMRGGLRSDLQRGLA